MIIAAKLLIAQALSRDLGSYRFGLIRFSSGWFELVRNFWREIHFEGFSRDFSILPLSFDFKRSTVD